MMSPQTGALRSDTAAPLREPDGRLRVAVIDRDSGFLRVLANRLEAVGWDLRPLPAPVTPERLVEMRLNALVADIAVLGPDSWHYLERLCARLPSMVVVICTGPSSVAQRVRGLRIGADAWITKPCHPEEVIAVVQSAVRRHRRSELPLMEQAIDVGEVRIRPDRHQAYVGELSLELTAREFEILYLLCQAGRVLRREEIYETLWGYAMARGDRSVDVFVGKLRQKLRSGSPGWTYIHTHFGVGYRFAAEREGGVAQPVQEGGFPVAQAHELTMLAGSRGHSEVQAQAAQPGSTATGR
ncbi:MAG: response regulator transcription factor [Solirubrobacterales bacterium]|nr:response regulator transcription factor [Solirubrobacterales bacterium]